HSRARSRVSFSIPALAAPAWTCSGVGTNDCVALMLTMQPFCAASAWWAARLALKVPQRSMSMTARKPFAESVAAGARKFPAAGAAGVVGRPVGVDAVGARGRPRRVAATGGGRGARGAPRRPDLAATRVELARRAAEEPDARALPRQRPGDARPDPRPAAG